MKLFGSKKSATAEKKETKKGNSSLTSGSSFARAGIEHTILLSPRITEKAAINAQSNAYTFNVHLFATKTQIAEAVYSLYGVVPEKVNLTPIRPKNVSRRQVPGKKSRGKKAYVYLKKGESIEFM